MNQLDAVTPFVIYRDEAELADALFAIAHHGDFAIAGQYSNWAVDPNLLIRQLD